MRWSSFALTALSALTALTTATNPSTAGIEALVRRRLPNHCEAFTFALTAPIPSYTVSKNDSTPPNDAYTVSNANPGKIHITGTTPSALASGLRWYLTTYAHVDIYWFLGSRLHLAPSHLPPVNCTYHGASVVPWRYHFNTVTFSYTSAFWTWTEWESQLDWMALRGVNLPLAWVGYEAILSSVFAEAGFSEADIASFLSGPAFQAWNHFGNIQGAWEGNLPQSWIDGQFELQKKIVERMVELGMTPVLPAFTGFVPRAIETKYPNASFVNGSQWEGFPVEYTNVTFLEPFDPLFTVLQKSFLEKQKEAYGGVTRFYALDQYNENNPFSGDLGYLRNVTENTMKSLKAADPDAVWLLQGWLFYSSQDFWTNERVEAYLGGVEDADMLILDLFSESQPQWQRTNSYYGKPWIWCELHDYGGNMGLYGQVENVTINPIAALANETSTMVGMGLTMEGQEGNEIMYDILLDQAWSAQPLDTETYFASWVTARYHGAHTLPAGLYKAWDTLRTTVYNVTDLTLGNAVTKSIFELSPNTTALLNRTGHHPTTIRYSPSDLVSAWRDLYHASTHQPNLWSNDPYIFDLTDLTRQVLANAFYPLYTTFVSSTNTSNPTALSPQKARKAAGDMLALLETLDALLLSSQIPHYNLGSWIGSARDWANSTTNPAVSNSPMAANTTALADLYEYSARNQLTLWGPTGQIPDYASKQWGGLIGTYYVPRWRMWIEAVLKGEVEANGQDEALKGELLAFEEGWQEMKMGNGSAFGIFGGAGKREFRREMGRVVREWRGVFGM